MAETEQKAAAHIRPENHEKASRSKNSHSVRRTNVHDEVRNELQQVIAGLQQDLDTCHEQLNVAKLLLQLMDRPDTDWQTDKVFLENRKQNQAGSRTDVQNTSAGHTGTDRLPTRREHSGKRGPEQPDPKASMTGSRKDRAYACERSGSRPGMTQKAGTGRLFRSRTDAESRRNTNSRHVKQEKIRDILFYVFLIMVVTAFLRLTMSSGGVKTFLGHSMFIVKSGSMETVYPKGSFIVTRQVDPDTLEVGDDITYMTGESATITHRIISIYEEYGNTGERGFRTQGIMNQNPDTEVVGAANVVGKVVFVSEPLGKIFVFITNNWPLLLFGTIIVILMIVVIQRILQMPEDDEEEPEDAGTGNKRFQHR